MAHNWLTMDSLEPKEQSKNSNPKAIHISQPLNPPTNQSSEKSMSFPPKPERCTGIQQALKIHRLMSHLQRAFETDTFMELNNSQADGF